jgi:hypothetical protein
MACTATRDDVPGAALHGDKDARDRENERDAKFSHLLGNRDRRKLRGHDLSVAELGDRTVLSRKASIRLICCNGLLQMILNLLTHALGQRRIKTQRQPRASPEPEITPAAGVAARPQEGLPWHLKTAARRLSAGKNLLAASGQRIDPPPPLLRVQFIIVGRAGMWTLLRVRA